jgi:hypothetical protein
MEKILQNFTLFIPEYQSRKMRASDYFLKRADPEKKQGSELIQAPQPLG